ncbi:insulinoma-associated protein 1-like [Tachysurus vachellii]|uniref:insulinoma-associated protein 1-like n=1 Tax=Tachysurus vachellii TaxID=175792 RepID=UPI00296B2E74|nr:insulinoma-associated protein 1-like [Tachysurus vachellii]
MPKGFLIKRSKKVGAVSYRVRDQDESTPNVLPSPGLHYFRGESLPSVIVQRTLNRMCLGGLPESFCSPSLSPTRPDAEGYADQYPSTHHNDQGSADLVSRPELFLEPVLGGFAVNGSPVSPSLPETSTKVDSITNSAKRPAPRSNSKSNQSKKHKPSQERKAVSRDEVTTSPVLGLRIKEDPVEDSKQRASRHLGEFICQLCKERYSDPLSLAHHKCSRIVRVEYRCTECDKTFSCPANLASHRRWHKPKGEENQPSTMNGSSATTQSENSDSGSEDEALFSCAQCAKKFRRQAYLRKHLALHERKAAGLRQDLNLSRLTESIVLSKEESREFSRKPPSTARATKTPDVFPCRFCAENFFSSPGLTRHINKHHPTESRQMILLAHNI